MDEVAIDRDASQRIIKIFKTPSLPSQASLDQNQARIDSQNYDATADAINTSEI
jgi:hypothetical protein